MARNDIRQLLRTQPGELWGVPMPRRVRSSPFLRAMRRAALTYLLRADALPRDHVVWHHHSMQTINFYRAGELAMRDLRIRPNDACAHLFGIALAFVAGSDRPLDNAWSRLAETGGLDFRWPFYYAFRDRLHFSYELLPAWLPILRRFVSEATLREFVQGALQKGDPEFLAVADTASESDIEEFLVYAKGLVER